MRVWKVLLPLVILFLAGVVLAQDSNSPSIANNVPPEDVIVPWTYFGPKPAPTASIRVDDPPQAATVSSETSDPDGAAPDPPPAVEVKQAVDPQSAQTPQTASSGQNTQIYEADISKKHPHPPEPVQLPVASQVAPPLTQSVPGVIDLKSGGQTQNGTSTQPETNKQTAVEAASAPQPSTPESQIIALTASYQQREANRVAELQQLKTAAAVNDPSAQLHAQIQETQLLLEGEQDHMQNAQELSKAYASLAGELEDRAGTVGDLADSRGEGTQAAEAELNQMKGIMPRLDLALHNFAMLPPNDENNQMIGTLEAELAQDENTRKFNQQRSVESQNEMKALQADAQLLKQAAATARQKSASYAEESQGAEANERMLSNKLEYLAARQSATDLLASASRVLGTPAKDITSAAATASAPGATTVFSSPSGQDVDSLRACLRQSANTNACVAKGDQ